MSRSFSNGHRVQCSFNLSRGALWGEVGQILAATLMGPAEPQLPPGPAAPLPMKAETSLPPAWLLGYSVASISRKMPGWAVEWVVSHPLNYFLLLMPVLTRAQAWGGCYTEWALCALDRDTDSLLSVRYQVRNRQVHQLGYRSSAVHGGCHQPLPTPGAIKCHQASWWHLDLHLPLLPPAHQPIHWMESCQKITGQIPCSTGEAALVYFLHGFQQPLVMNVKPLHFPWKDLTKPSHRLLIILLLFTSLSPDFLNGLRNSQIFIPGGNLSDSPYMQILKVYNSNCVD